MEQVIVNDLVISVTRKRIKNLYLSINHTGGNIRISAPMKMREEFIRQFVISKLDWIKKRKAKFEARSSRKPANLQYSSGEYHYFQGKAYLLTVAELKSQNTVILDEAGSLTLIVRDSSSLLKRKKTLEKWYREQLELMIEPLFEKWQPMIGVKMLECKIKKMKTKWGTCNIRTGRIWLNLELVKMPLHCVEYIVVHELVHLLERFHNKRFYAFMDTFLPSWRHSRGELNTIVV